MRRNGFDLTTIPREELEWLASISTDHEAELYRRQRDEIRILEEQELDDFVRDIVEPDWHRHRHIPLSEGTLRFVDEITGRVDTYSEQTGWDASKHPREGGPPNAGWFRSTTGASAGAGHAGVHDQYSDRAHVKIGLTSGKNWSGDRVLDVLARVAPDWLPFVRGHVTLAGTSYGEEATTTVRIGENGPEVSQSPGSLNEPGQKTIHLGIPPDWNDVQVTQHILTQIADHSDAHRVAAQWAVDRPGLLAALRSERFRNGLSTIETLAKGYHSALAGLAPGGSAAVATWDIQHGDYLSAALGLAFMLPLGKIAKAGVEKVGTIVLKDGEKLKAILPVKLISRVEKLTPDQLALLNKRLQGAQNDNELARIVNDFVGTPFNKHHPLAKFLGGDELQLLANIPKKVHDEFHHELRHELRASGFKLPFGSHAGSTRRWVDDLAANPGAQSKAFDAILKVSRSMDAKHGTEITSAVWKNIFSENFIVLP